MKINEVLRQDNSEFRVLVDECSQFIEESQRTPLLRALPCTYQNVHKVKVRKKSAGTVDHPFNEAFDERDPHLRQRAVFTYGQIKETIEGMEPFFVFPIDGYKFMYSLEVTNSGQEYQHVFESIFESLGDERGNEVITDMLKFTYTHESLVEGITSGAEVVLYNIPLYYAVRVNDPNIAALTDLHIL